MSRRTSVVRVVTSKLSKYYYSVNWTLCYPKPLIWSIQATWLISLNSNWFYFLSNKTIFSFFSISLTTLLLLLSFLPFHLTSFFFFFFKHKKKIDEKPFSIFLKSKPQGNKEEDVERKRRIGGKKKRKKKVGGWRNKSREKVKIYILKNFKFNNLKS